MSVGCVSIKCQAENLLFFCSDEIVKVPHFSSSDLEPMNGRDDCGKEQHKTDGAAQALLSVGQVVTIPVDQLASANKNNAPQCLEREFCPISLQNAHRKV